MDANDLRIIRSADIGDPQFAAVLQKFVKQHAQTFDLSAISSAGQWLPVWTAMFRVLDAAAPGETVARLFPDALHALRILSRDGANTNTHTTEAQFDALLRIANLGAQPDDGQRLPDAVMAEALRCMCNMVHQSKHCQAMCVRNAALSGIVRRLRAAKCTPLAYELQYFDMKLLYIITGLSEDARPKLRDDLYGLMYLAETLELIVRQHGPTTLADGTVVPAQRLPDRQVDLVCEILKVLFNITYRTEDTAVATDEEEADSLGRLAACLHGLLRCQTLNRDKHTELCSHAVNLLTNVPVACFAQLALPAVEVDAEAPGTGQQLFEAHDVTVPHVLLSFLRQRLAASEAPHADQKTLLAPVLVALIKAVRSAPVQRRYVRSLVLPPLRDVQQRPEIGQAMRNQLCRLLTAAATTVRDLVAEFLFVLCKEDVWRMTKYTGYGNAAGLFANRGLLGGGVPGARTAGGAYSSDSEDSDTEEYRRVLHQINPVLGCMEPPRQHDPFAGMSDEQKEYEAMQLVQLMEKLNRSGVVQPCRVGDDGRPVPVEHILELQDARTDTAKAGQPTQKP